MACPLSVTITTNPPRSRADVDFLSHVHQQPQHIIQNVYPRARFILRGPDPRRRWRRDHRTYFFFSNSTRLLSMRPLLQGKEKVDGMKYIGGLRTAIQPTRLERLCDSTLVLYCGKALRLFRGHQCLSYVLHFHLPENHGWRAEGFGQIYRVLTKMSF